MTHVKSLLSKVGVLRGKFFKVSPSNWKTMALLVCVSFSPSQAPWSESGNVHLAPVLQNIIKLVVIWFTVYNIAIKKT
jgi:hypothetical protein